ncbi:MAG: hypothetical protein K9L28_07515 [Synergistales bacterium]|nr:hypothetical protein [Synergistales bacterium]
MRNPVRRLSVKTQMLLAIAAIITVVFATIFLAGGLYVRQTARENAMDSAELSAVREAAKIEQEVHAAFAVARTLAHTMESVVRGPGLGTRRPLRERSPRPGTAHHGNGIIWRAAAAGSGSP